MSWHFIKDAGDTHIDIEITELSCRYKSNLAENGNTPVPILDGGEFWGDMYIWVRNLSNVASRFIFMMGLNINGTFQNVQSSLVIPVRDYFVGLTIPLPHAILSAPGFEPGRTIDTQKQINWGRYVVAYDGDAMSYRIATVNVGDISIEKALIYHE